MIAMPMPASPQKSSSIATGSVRPVESLKAFIMNSQPYRPIFAASSTTGYGNSSRSSHSWAAGRMTSSANPWIHFWIWSWSSFSEKSAMAASYPPVTTTATGRDRPVCQRFVKCVRHRRRR